MTDVPSSIDATGGSDVTSSLTDFLNSLPDNATAQMPRKAKYRCDGVLDVVGKKGLIIAGNDSVLTTVPTDDGQRAQLRLSGGSALTVKNLTVKGAAQPRDPLNAFVDTLQWQHNVDVRGVNGLTLTNVDARDSYGDGFYFGLGPGSVGTKGVIANACSVKRNGRQGVAAVYVDGLTFSHGVFDDISLMTFNVEPNPGCSVANVEFSDNDVRYGPRQQLLGLVGHGPIDRVTLARNILAGKAITVWAESADATRRMTNIIVSDNVSDTPLANYMVDAFRVDGLVVTNNTQPLAGGQFRHTTDCTAVNFSGNHQ